MPTKWSSSKTEAGRREGIILDLHATVAESLHPVPKMLPGEAAPPGKAQQKGLPQGRTAGK